MSRVVRFLFLSTIAVLSCLVGEPRAYAAVSITIDATALTSPIFDLSGVPGSHSTAIVQTFSLNAGPTTFRDGRGNAFVFTVDALGDISYDPGFEDFLDGSGTSTLEIDGFSLSVDATALTTATFDLPSITSVLSSSTAHTYTGIPGLLYAFRDGVGNHVAFTVDNDGKYAYDPGFEDFLSGAGSSTLVLDGFGLTIDATALTSPTFDVPSITSILSTSTVQTFTGVPGSLYFVRDAVGNNVGFSVDANGKYGYDPGVEVFLDGAGTSDLVVGGFVITVDARGLPDPTFDIPSITPILSSAVVHTFSGIPGSLYAFRDTSSAFVFTVDSAGLVQSLPPTFAGVPVSGNGTSTLTVGDTNDPPTADAGPDQAIHAGQTVNLDGTGSFDDQTATVDLDYDWSFMSKPVGSVAVLTDPTTATPSFVADLPGTYVVKLIVTDEELELSVPDTVTISSTNVAPTADAGTDQVVGIGELATLDGSGSSDPETDPLTFSWVLTSAPVGSVAALVDATTASPTLTPDLEGSYVVELVVNDGFAPSPPDEVVIMARGPVFAQQQLGDACDFVSALPDASFDAKGHRKSMCNKYAKIIKFIQKGKTSQAIAHLGSAIERVDGCTLRGSPDPKGGGQPHAADYLVICAEQEHVYDLLTSALDAID